jgi:hypothetical protein
MADSPDHHVLPILDQLILCMFVDLFKDQRFPPMRKCASRCGERKISDVELVLAFCDACSRMGEALDEYGERE